jgi:hypothetical protein
MENCGGRQINVSENNGEELYDEEYIILYLFM